MYKREFAHKSDVLIVANETDKTRFKAVLKMAQFLDSAAIGTPLGVAAANALESLQTLNALVQKIGE